MFMRFVQVKVKPDYLDEIRDLYETVTLSVLQRTSGCLFAGLIESSAKEEEFISITMWETQQQADTYENSDVFREMLEKYRPILAESSEWKIQLSKDMQLEYAPVPEEPVIKELPITAQTDDDAPATPGSSRMYVRFVSVKIAGDKLDEFRRIYTNEILPALQETEGCRYAYLTENLQEKNEILSVTIWDSQRHAEEYENSGRFAESNPKSERIRSPAYINGRWHWKKNPAWKFPRHRT